MTAPLVSLFYSQKFVTLREVDIVTDCIVIYGGQVLGQIHVWCLKYY